MNTREKILLFALIGVVGLPALIYGGKRWWWDPLREYHAQAAKLQEDVNAINLDLENFHDGQARLNKARLRSLPADVDKASAEYNLQYLQPMLLKSGLAVEQVNAGKSVQKMKVVTPIQGVTTVGHQILTFTVRASGELPALITALERMQKTPYEHRIKSLTIDRAEPANSKKQSNKLNIQLNIEVLLVAGTKNTTSTTLDPTLVQPGPENRQYAEISKRNIFVGALPPDPVKTKPGNTDYDPTENTPQYVYLTHTSPDEQIAYLRNRVSDRPEIKVMAKPGSGYDTFVIRDEGREDDKRRHEFFRAKVLKVEQRRIFIQIKDEVFTVQIGRPLSDMQIYGYNVSRIEMEDDGLFDPDFAKKEKARLPADQKDNKGNTKKKGR
jgi:hypothetical protein